MCYPHSLCYQKACRSQLSAPIGYPISMRIGIAQTNPAFGEVDRNIAKALELIGKERADLWVLPELFATGYQFVSSDEAKELSEPVPDGPTTRALIDRAKARGCHIVAGLPERDGDRIYNAAVLVGPEGFLSCYRKVHLFSREKEHFAPGDRSFPVLDIGIARIGLMVCFDHLFPESARSLALQGADVIAHPANLVLPDLAQRTMRVRALENGVFTATANRVGHESRTNETLVYTGQSQVVGPDGEVLVRLSGDKIEIGVAGIDVERARDKRITDWNDVLADRRADQYRLGGPG